MLVKILQCVREDFDMNIRVDNVGVVASSMESEKSLPVYFRNIVESTNDFVSIEQKSICVSVCLTLNVFI